MDPYYMQQHGGRGFDAASITSLDCVCLCLSVSLSVSACVCLCISASLSVSLCLSVCVYLSVTENGNVKLERQTGRDRDTKIETQKDRDTPTDTERYRERGGERDTQTHTDRNSMSYSRWMSECASEWHCLIYVSRTLWRTSWMTSDRYCSSSFSLHYRKLNND